MSRLVAEGLRARLEHLGVAKENLIRWQRTCAPNVQATLAEWQAVVDSGLEAVLTVLAGEDERSVRLRQSSPFMGEEIVTPAERDLLIRQFSP